MSGADGAFHVFGDRRAFALEVRLIPDPEAAGSPSDSVGSWGAWRLWVADVNLCSLQMRTPSELIEVDEVRWYLAPLFRWLIENWTPLLHEARLPRGGGGDSRPRVARAAYLGMLEQAGDDAERFGPWQEWASRHSIRSASEGGIVPDVFLQRCGDEIEFSWGDRIQPGGEAAMFLAEAGFSRADVDVVGRALREATDWFLTQPSIVATDWSGSLISRWQALNAASSGEEALNWFLDGQANDGVLTALFRRALTHLKRSFSPPSGLWWSPLAPEVAMFGDLSPQISEDASVNLLSEYFASKTNESESDALSELVSDEPAWLAYSPWDNGYALAADILDRADPDPDKSFTDIDSIIRILSIDVRDVDLDIEGPRGVALAGLGVRPTILVNVKSPSNKRYGRRFTVAHELCHILFDRPRARPLTHSSSPWASSSVEQRANAFAAMLLMPLSRARRPTAKNLDDLKQSVNALADRLKVGRVALRRHLANLDEIDPYELDYLLSDG